MSIDELLRDALRDDRYALPGWPDATARVRAGMSRRRRRQTAIAVAAVAAVAALATPAAISLSSYPTTPSLGPKIAATPSPGQVIPWQERPVNPSASFGPDSSQGLVVAGIDVASSVDPGTDLAYVVVLENRSNRDLPLDPCPVFTQHLGNDGGSYLLNCTVATLPANSWIRLQMRLRVSATAPAGLETLSWTIDVDGQVASTIANVTIR
jgi:hypothetical protein